MQYFAAYDDTYVNGIGHTEDEALADALANCPDLTDLRVSECTAGLFHEVQERGGCIMWDENPHGLLVLHPDIAED